MSMTDKSVRRKWSLESKHQFMLRCDRGAFVCHKVLLTPTTTGDTGVALQLSIILAVFNILLVILMTNQVIV